MTTQEKELDRLFDAPILKPPVGFLDRVMRQVDHEPSVQFSRLGVVHQQAIAENRLKEVSLKLTKLAAFVFGIMLATAAV